MKNINNNNNSAINNYTITILYIYQLQKHNKQASLSHFTKQKETF